MVGMVMVVVMVLWHDSSSRVEVTRAVLNQGKRFVAVMALDTGIYNSVTAVGFSVRT